MKVDIDSRMVASLQDEAVAKLNSPRFGAAAEAR